MILLLLIFILIFTWQSGNRRSIVRWVAAGNADHAGVSVDPLQNAQNCRLGSGRREPDSRKHWPHRRFQKWGSENATRENPVHAGVCVEQPHLTYLYLYFLILLFIFTGDLVAETHGTGGLVAKVYTNRDVIRWARRLTTLAPNSVLCSR